jgi:eukaryotic-like serine/threonine-protein kinase
MLTKSGAKLLDFGLAKLQQQPSPIAAALTEMTVEDKRLTVEGMLVGTFQYMAPEQLEGKEPDARSDIFALGAVLYEMLTGKAAFNGKTKASIIAAVLSSDPPTISTSQPLAPPALDRVVTQCLAKDPDERWQSAGDAARELKWVAESGSQTGVAPLVSAKQKARERLAWILAAGALCAAVVLAGFYVRERKPQSENSLRFYIFPEENTTPLLTQDNAGPVVLAPDGSALAFVATDAQGQILLWVRKLNDLHARPLPGSEGANHPFWSADSHFLGFFAGGKLKTVSAEGGSLSVVCDAPLGRGGAWNANGIILFSPTFESPLYQVSASGGTPSAVTTLDKSKHDSHRWPRFLPDGRHFLYLAINHNEPRSPNDGIYFASLDGKENRLLAQAFSNADYAAGRLLFIRDTTLLAQPFDPDKGTLQGAAMPVAEQVLVDPSTWRAVFAVTDGGTLAYVAGGVATDQLTWYDRSGKDLGLVADKVLNLNHVRISPDGQRIAVDSGEAISEIWIYEVPRGVSTRFTFGPGSSNAPVWSPDGKWIAYATLQNGHLSIYRKLSSGMGQRELLFEGNDKNVQNWPNSWAPDGKSLLFTVGDLVRTAQLWELPLTGDDRKPKPVMPSGFMMQQARFSPDGRWIAYTSDESGRAEVYVVPSSWSGGKSQISNGSGQQPVWGRDEKELFYLTTDDTLMSVPVVLKRESVELGAARPLFRLAHTILGGAGLVVPYDVTPDGKRFIVITANQAKSLPIILVTNWIAALNK